jgi:hypothetical protein
MALRRMLGVFAIGGTALALAAGAARSANGEMITVTYSIGGFSSEYLTGFITPLTGTAKVFVIAKRASPMATFGMIGGGRVVSVSLKAGPTHIMSAASLWTVGKGAVKGVHSFFFPAYGSFMGLSSAAPKFTPLGTFMFANTPPTFSPMAIARLGNANLYGGFVTFGQLYLMGSGMLTPSMYLATGSAAICFDTKSGMGVGPCFTGATPGPSAMGAGSLQGFIGLGAEIARVVPEPESSPMLVAGLLTLAILALVSGGCWRWSARRSN